MIKAPCATLYDKCLLLHKLTYRFNFLKALSTKHINGISKCRFIKEILFENGVFVIFTTLISFMLFLDFP